MPDRNGYQTLRDRFPIVCDVCKQQIEPARYRDGECVSEDEPYWVLGHQWGDDIIPMNIYAHRACLTWQPTDQHTPRERVTGNYCVYCNAPCGEDYCCPECKAAYDRDMRTRAPGDEVLELIKQLKAMAPPPLPKVTPDPGARRISEGAPKPKPAQPIAPKPSLEIEADKIGAFIPQNELGVVFMFGGVIDKIGYRMAHIKASYPDAVLVGKNNKPIRVEFEFTSSNFIAHKHDPELCDMVICWDLDKSLPLPVIALSRHYDPKRESWDFSDVGRFAVGTL